MCRPPKSQKLYPPFSSIEAADLGPACWFMVSRWALAPVAACGEATKPGLAPNGTHFSGFSSVSLSFSLHLRF
jgi:hypothetical protein